MYWCLNTTKCLELFNAAHTRRTSSRNYILVYCERLKEYVFFVFTPKMHFDEFLRKVGEFGRFQKRIYFLVCFTGVMMGCHMVISVPLVEVGKYRCRIPSYPGDSYKIQNEEHRHLINISIPSKINELGELEYDGCGRYLPNSSDHKNDSGLRVKCDSWVYDRSVFESTFGTEKNLVCDRALWSATASMVFFFGFLVGALFFGWLSDIKGRKTTVCISVLLLFVFSLSVAWAPDFYTFCVLRAFVGMSCAGTFLSGFVLGMELVGPSKRIWAGVIIHVFFAFGLMSPAGAGYGLRHWKYVEIACSAPIIIFQLYWWFLPESPRWLLNRGRKEEAKVILRMMAEENNVTITEKELDDIDCDSTSSTDKLYHLFQSKVLLIRTLVIFFNWMVIVMGYYGFSLYAGNLAGNFHLNFFLSGLVDIPASVICLLILDRAGRRKLYFCSTVFGGLACISTIFTIMLLEKDFQQITVVLAMLGKTGISVGLTVVYAWSAEIYPTSLRNVGMGASSSCARIGGMVCPYIADLGKVIDGRMGQAVPLMVFGGASILAGILSLLLPETMNKNLPETIKDGKEFGKKITKYDEKTGVSNQGFEIDGTITTKL